MTARKYGYRRRRSDNAERVNDELLFCKDRPASEFVNVFRWCDWSGFSETVASIWFHHRDEVVPQWLKSHPGTRPNCWWVYEANMNVNDVPRTAMDQALLLARLGHLTAAERKRLPKEWFVSIPPKLRIV